MEKIAHQIRGSGTTLTISPFLSFIIPAYNEALELGSALESITAAAQAVGHSFEILVVNDASTDETAAIARAAGAQVVDVNLRRISSVRNAGAHAAHGDVFIFVDADTRLPERVLRSTVAALDAGAVGGGAYVHYDARANRAINTVITIFNFLYMGICRWAAGCYVFARRDAFTAVGGFDETLYATEEIALSRRLKKQGRFVIVFEEVITSSRKLRLYSLFWPFRLLLRMALHGTRVLKQREGLDLWYDGKREK